MPNPTTNFRDSFGTDLGNKLISKDYLISVYPNIANQLITPELWVWGRNYSGQLASNTTNSISNASPRTTFAGGSNWKQIAITGSGQGRGGVGFNAQHAAVIKNDGTLWLWCDNINNQLGINAGGNRCTPVTTFAGGTNWKQVECGQNSTAAIKTDGTLWTWGAGPLGNNILFSTRSTPSPIFAGGTNWKQVSCGDQHMAAVKTDGTLWTWGDNNSAQLGINTGSGTIISPVTTFAGGTNWKQVACGKDHIAAIKTDGTLWTWGINNNAQLGDTTAINRSTPVTTFAGGTNWKLVACGWDVTLAIKTDGTLWSWGRNDQGQLGINVTGNRSTPVTTFAGGTNWKQVTSGRQHTAAIKTDGTLWAWGSGSSYGQLGNSTGTSYTPITTLSGGSNWKEVVASTNFTLAIRTSDDLQGI